MGVWSFRFNNTTFD